MVGRRGRTITTLIVGGLLLAVAPAGATPGAARRSAPEPLVQADDFRVAFSPNGDNRKDTGKFGFRLNRTATVTAKVRRNGNTVRGPVRLGRLAPGHHVWRWDGRNNRDRIVSDGSYRVLLSATRAAKKTSVRVDTDVATVFDRGTIRTTRRTVHPRATQVSDRVQLVYLQPGWDAAAEFDLDDVPMARLEVRTPSGDVIYHRTVRNQVTPTWSWNGTRDSGRPARAGRYLAHIAVQDVAGNGGSFRRRLVVSEAQLVEQVLTQTVSAAGAGTYEPFFDGCNGCGEFCAPVASTVFVDGLSFQSCPPFRRTAKFFAADVGFREAPIDSYRITVTGSATGPTGSDQGAVGLSSTGPGGTAATTPWQTVTLTDYPYLPDQSHPIIWNFHTEDANTYDVATFTIEYRHYVPAPNN